MSERESVSESESEGESESESESEKKNGQIAKGCSSMQLSFGSLVKHFKVSGIIKI